MEQIFSTLDFETKGQGFTDITKDIKDWIQYKKLQKGILLIFLKHTVCSLIINENADINVLKDLSAYMKAIVPEEGFYPIDRSSRKSRISSFSRRVRRYACSYQNNAYFK